MKTQEIRQAFIKFFAEKQHEVVASAPLVPQDDPTLLFVNAGMVQFKNLFLGQEKRDYARATSSQTCVRAGGKHNDLENVGYTARHHTFFEMLGNFSFGDYFKREAIQFAWQFLTEELKLPVDKLWVTVFEKDDEAAAIWLNEVGVDPQRFSRIGEKDNFWSMGETGPCGPCTEIFYDHGAAIPGGPPGTPEEDGDRYIEIWNLVFMQYDRQADGALKPLPKPSVDTGMGLERIAAVMQGVHDNYDIDLFQHLIKAAAKITQQGHTKQTEGNKALRVLADHIRACSFLIKDGVLPANEGRGYVLRRIIRRAIRHGHQLGVKDVFFYKLVEPLVEVMGDAYPELAKKQSQIEKVLQQEEAQFAKTLDQGLKILSDAMIHHQGDQLSGEVAFKLYDTYGFPLDLTADVAREEGLTIDLEAFEACMAEQRARARLATRFDQSKTQKIRIDQQTEFVGYDHDSERSEAVSLFDDRGESVKRLDVGEQGSVVLKVSPFYAESGGQVGDCGKLQFEDGEFAVDDTQKAGDAIVHHGIMVSGTLHQGQIVDAVIDQVARQATRCNHSATHLLHAALRNVLGEHVEQKGSLVGPDRLRFDFSHPQALSAEQLAAIEDSVNAQIRANHLVVTTETDMAQANAMGAMALFGEKYGDQVRVLSMGAFSTELCGGTHVARTGDIGYFKIVSESGIASGIRRIEAMTGQLAVDTARSESHQLSVVAQVLKAKPEGLTEKLQQLMQKQKQLEKTVTQLQSHTSNITATDLAAQAIKLGDIQLLAIEIDGVDPKAMRSMLDELKLKLKKAIIVLGLKNSDKVNLIAGVTDNLTDKFKAGELVNYVAQQVGGKGGGRADMAQAGGTEPEKLAEALHSLEQWIEAKL